jgi:hypothetical protein
MKMKMKTRDRVAEAILGAMFTALLVSFGWVIESNQAIAFGRGKFGGYPTVVSDPGLVDGFAAFVFLIAAAFAGLMAGRLGLNAFWSMAVAALVFLHPVPILLFH